MCISVGLLPKERGGAGAALFDLLCPAGLHTTLTIFIRIFLTYLFAWLRSGQFRGQKGLGPLEKPRYMFCPQKKVISWTFKISGTLIVTMSCWPTYYTYLIHADFPNVSVCQAIFNSVG
jgi:hypothetical protein